ncbi:hypothetical protein [Thalassotalea piscium]|uniref:Uncharacterized membrane protein YhaH (DUF805 family) n=1 Tax=Thalassotalea piscium TaxID=1230533 RepID=A0A7X0NKB4_9GAMM|nr:hypothetical protein [Thalassotalea piscium]MBB6545013.1 uncharacterized membrane protein YhaH (DUF805 family) [Thalassotalea piscium]
MQNVSANSVFLKGFRYMFWIWLVLLTLVFLLSVSLRAEVSIEITNLAFAYIGIVVTSLFLSFITAYFIVKKAIDSGEISDSNIFTKGGKLSLNIFSQKLK